VVAIGLALGLFGSFVLTRGLRVFVSATSTANPWTFASAVLLVGVVALVAAWVPARRATDMDPLIALRIE
jgi:ABC-type antimicrobial peptide transport system permease subunit